MEIKVCVKQLGKKHPLLKDRIIEIAEIGPAPSLKTLLEAVVEQQVNEYNQKTCESDETGAENRPEFGYLPILTDTGKAGFGSIYNQNKADFVKARETAIQAFEDGLFAVFLEDEELNDLSQPLSLSPEKRITFIRLTFLAGSYW